MNMTSIMENLNIAGVMDDLTILNRALPILVYLFIALIVTKIPYVRVYFSNLNTLLREVIRVILEGVVANRINLQHTGSRNMTIAENSRFKNTLITYVGYTGESVAAIVLFYLVSNQSYQMIVYLFIGLIAGAAILWVRHFWSIMWALSFVVLLALPIYFGYSIAIMHISIFLAAILLVQSIVNGIRVCRQSFLERKNRSESGLFARVKFIPAMMLGIIILGQSLYTGYYIVINFLRIH